MKKEILFNVRMFGCLMLFKLSEGGSGKVLWGSLAAYCLFMYLYKQYKIQK